MSIRTFLLIFSTTVCLSTAVAQTTTTNTREFDFPMISFGTNESLEVNVINVAAISTATGGAAASCTGSIAFHNSAGAVIGSPTPFTLTSGQITSARLPFASATSTGGRAAVRAIVDLTFPTTTPRPPCSLQFSVEIFDGSTNATHVYVSGGSLNGGGGPLPR